ncbi:class I SAM-dependent methyltransferase [Micropruina sp.]|uniref:class I SAM-dependent methyltransferase n=1 Tax=Micropruina sp. TaxID=2737536 RepID=UPI0039E3634C
MQPSGAGAFNVAGEAYDNYMGRYSKPLAVEFAAFVGCGAADRVLDVGCGPGALTAELVRRVGAANVMACDPSPRFVADCAQRNVGVDVRAGSAERLPFDDDSVHAALAQLVLHFVGDPSAAAAELARVVRPGGRVAACVWDFDQGMELLRAFWDAALTLDPEAPDEARVLRFGRLGEIAGWLACGGFADIVETTLTVTSTYRDYAELWEGLQHGIGPAGSYLVAQSDELRERLRGALFERLGRPAGAFTLAAVARTAKGRLPR